jgi:hypothetical protein
MVGTRLLLAGTVTAAVAGLVIVPAGGSGRGAYGGDRPKRPAASARGLIGPPLESALLPPSVWSDGWTSAVAGTVLLKVLVDQARSKSTARIRFSAQSPLGRIQGGGQFSTIGDGHPTLSFAATCAQRDGRPTRYAGLRIDDSSYSNGECGLPAKVDMPPGKSWLVLRAEDLMSREYAWLLETDLEQRARHGAIVDQIVPVEPLQPLVLLDLVPTARQVSATGFPRGVATFEFEVSFEKIADEIDWRLPENVIQWLIYHGAKTLRMRLVVGEDCLLRRMEWRWSTDAGPVRQVIEYYDWGEPIAFEMPDPSTVATPGEANLRPAFEVADS